MSLFPAYSKDVVCDSVSSLVLNEKELLSGGFEISTASPAAEDRLLASESEDDETPPPPRIASAEWSPEYYMDTKADRANLSVSTLYFPGRPEYKQKDRVLGMPPYMSQKSRRKRRYYKQVESDVAEAARVAEEVARRTESYRAALRDTPFDEKLWVEFIDFQSRHCAPSLALHSATEATSRGVCEVPLLRRMVDLSWGESGHEERLMTLIANEKRGEVATWLWCELLLATGGECVEKALEATRRYKGAYNQIIYTYCLTLREAGHWERCVVLLQMLAELHLEQLPTPAAPVEEEKLQQLEDQMMSCGLPLHTVWRRVERLRSAAHWVPAEDPSLATDPDRVPGRSQSADLLHPLTDSADLFQLAVNIIRSLDVPLLVAGPSRRVGPDWWSGPERAGATLARVLGLRRGDVTPVVTSLDQILDPPHVMSPEHGLSVWAESVWTTLAGHFVGPERDGLLCWFVRWAHCWGRLTGNEKEARTSVRRVLQAVRPCGPLPAVEAALLRGGRAALLAARGAGSGGLRGEERLYVAGLCQSLWPPTSDVGRWPVVCAVLARPLPDWLVEGEGGSVGPPKELEKLAVEEIDRQCAVIEESLLSAPPTPPRPAALLLPRAALWGRARGRLRAGELRKWGEGEWKDVCWSCDSSPTAADYWGEVVRGLEEAEGEGARGARLYAPRRPELPSSTADTLLADLLDRPWPPPRRTISRALHSPSARRSGALWALAGAAGVAGPGAAVMSRSKLTVLLQEDAPAALMEELLLERAARLRVLVAELVT